MNPAALQFKVMVGTVQKFDFSTVVARYTQILTKHKHLSFYETKKKPGISLTAAFLQQVKDRAQWCEDAMRS